MGIALLAILIFICFQFVPMYYKSVYLCVLKTFITLSLFYIAITNDYLKRILSIKIITIIGGMCYSIYLLHMGIYGIMRHGFFDIKFFNNTVLSIMLHYCIGVISVLVISGIFFLLVEKPAMRRDWYKGIFSKRKLIIYKPPYQ
jgi:peptidoglycan/LPS O-acetylase OafA/YrhL